MIITCSECRTRYVVDPAKLGLAGRTVRCAKCHHSWFQPAPDEESPKVTRVAARPAEPATGVERAPQRPQSAPEPAPPPPEQEAAAAAPPSHEEDQLAALRARRKQLAEEATKIPDTAASVADEEYVRNLPAFPRQRANTALVAGWVALAILVVGVLGTVFFTFSEAIAERLPISRRIYDAMGVSIDGAADPLSSLRIEATESERRSQNGMIHLAITGRIANVGAGRTEVPLLRGVLRNGDEEEVYSWTFRADERRVEGGASVPFETEVLDIPETATSLDILFDAHYRTLKRARRG